MARKHIGLPGWKTIGTLSLVLTVALMALWSPASAPAASITTPRVFDNDLNASVATDGKKLWVTKTGVNKNSRSLRTKSFLLNGRRWVALPGKPRTAYSRIVSAAYQPSTNSGARLCVGDTDPRKSQKKAPRLRCFFKKQWRPVKISGDLRSLDLVGLSAEGGNLTGLFQKMRRTSTDIRIGRIDGSQMVSYGPPLVLDAQYLPTLGLATTSSVTDAVDVALENFNDESRSVATLTDSNWTMSEPLPPLIMGSQTSGSVRSGKGLYFPVSQAVREGPNIYDWPFSVYRQSEEGPWSRVGQVLNQGDGSAQGGIYPVGDQIWAIWNQNVWVKDWYGPVKILAARVDDGGADFERPRVLWKGKSIVAGSTQAVEYRRAPAFLFMRQFKRKGGQFATLSIAR